MTAANEPEWTDEDFVPREGMDDVEQLREFVRKLLAEGVTQSDIEDLLIQSGMDSDHAIRLVSSVITTGQGGYLEVGTEASLGGTSLGFLHNPTFGQRLRLIRRTQRRDREAAEGPSAPNPELAFDDAKSPTDAGRRYQRGQTIRFCIVLFTLTALVVLGVLYAFRK